ncbi:TetR/AcrR family transcriptional regulator [Eubacteriales bacterium OttesenSCG-928-A19]|nr:TetR/AcrR family transcriptional regulator [Eubacteriales bacterium OttesenSCG-928-A19]
MPNSKYSDTTKRQLAESLKKSMAQKPLEKITIRELVEDCGLNRQTFYYHFEDIYDLLKWMFQQEAVSLLEKHEGTMVWQDGLLQLFRYLEDNRAICLCALHSLGHAHLKRFFYTDINSIVARAVETLSEEHAIPQKNVTFISHVLTLSLAALMESWLLGEMDCTPEVLLSEIDVLLQNQMKGAQINLGSAR